MARKQQTGFTIIELVITITIIAILAAIALPKYVSLQADARLAKMNAIRGALSSAAALARARCELDLVATPVGTCTATAGTANMDGTAVAMVNKYPQALLPPALGILAAISMTPGTSIATAKDGVFATLAGTTLTITPVGATTPASCTITYTNAAVGAAPAITLNPLATTATC